MEMDEEVDLMNKALTGELVEELPKEEPVVEESKKEELPKEDDLKTEGDEEEVIEKSEEKKEEKPKVEEPPKEEKVEPTVDERDKVITDLKAELEMLKAKLEPPKETVKKEELKPEPLDFLKDKDLDDLTRDPKEFNKLLNEIRDKTALETEARVLKTLPDLVKEQVVFQMQAMDMANQFYSANPDLASYKPNVGIIFAEIQAKNPDKQYSDLITEVATEARKRLNLKPPSKKKVETKKESDPVPKLPKKGGSAGKLSSKQPAVSPVEDDIAAMNQSLGR